MDKSLPPQALDVEEIVLGGILLDPRVLEKIPNLKPEHFYATSHQVIFQACQYLVENDQQIDLITVVQRLEDIGKLERIGGLSGAVRLMDRVVSTVNIDKYAQILIQKYQRRKLIENAHKLIELGHSEELELAQIFVEAEALLTQATSEESAKGLLHLGDIIPTLHDQLHTRRFDAIPTGLTHLDWYFNGGLRPKELMVVAGRAAMGKSFVGNFLAQAIARTGKPVAVFSAEMDALSITKRFLGAVAGIEISKLIANNIQNDDYDALYDGYQKLSDLPIYVDDIPGSRVTIPYLFSQCNKLKRQHGQIGAVIVDYLQLLGDRAAFNRAADIGKYSAALKDLSKQLDTRVIALAQINREVEGMKNKRPSMAQIKDSGSIEQDADAIIILYREEYYNPDTPNRGILELNIVKNRNGSTGLVKVCFDPSLGKITNLRNFVEEF